MLGHKAFGMKLYSVNRKCSMRNPHSDPVLRPSGYGQICLRFSCRRRNDQRMITGHPERRRHICKDALCGVINRTGLSVHGLLCPDRFAAKNFIDALHAQTNAQYGCFLTQPFNDIAGNGCMGGVLWAWADQYVVWGKVSCLWQGDSIITKNRYRKIILGKHLYEIIGE